MVYGRCYDVAAMSPSSVDDVAGAETKLEF